MSENEVTTIAGGITVVDDGDLVSASSEPITQDAEPSAPVEEASAEPEVEAAPKDDAEGDRDAHGRFVKPKDGKPPVERRKESIQAQIDRARYELGEETRRLERVRQERQQLESSKPSTTPAPVTTQPGTTTFKDFVVDYAAKNPNATYEDAIDAFQSVREDAILSKLEQKTRQDSESREQDTLMQTHRGRVAELAKTVPDLDAKIAATEAYLADRGVNTLPPVLFGAILRSDKSAQIVQHLSEHPEVAYQVALDSQELPATPAAVKVMRTVLESQIASNGSTPAPRTGPVAAPRQSRSNPPPNPVGSSPVAPEPSDDEPSYDQMLERVTKHLHRR